MAAEMKVPAMSERDAERILSDFFADRRNSVGDYWGKDMVLEAMESLLGRKIEETP